ncbi:hypothetical protein CEXT_48771 [Caerostris extrusa]|uniref:Uncharacterized protein n=1 Tax=Caerostris extrusa TaxID=172846 RepID=A0AAV4T1F7_CAEEX|nr:hypothetical protein CEXT_48771 [Caerostris extrusa]
MHNLELRRSLLDMNPKSKFTELRISVHLKIQQSKHARAQGRRTLSGICLIHKLLSPNSSPKATTNLHPQAPLALLQVLNASFKINTISFSASSFSWSSLVSLENWTAYAPGASTNTDNEIQSPEDPFGYESKSKFNVLRISVRLKIQQSKHARAQGRRTLSGICLIHKLLSPSSSPKATTHLHPQGPLALLQVLNASFKIQYPVFSVFSWSSLVSLGDWTADAPGASTNTDNEIQSRVRPWDSGGLNSLYGDLKELNSTIDSIIAVLDESLHQTTDQMKCTLLQFLVLGDIHILEDTSLAIIMA